MQTAVLSNTYDYPFSIKPITHIGGGEITGLDLSKQISSNVLDAIKRAFLEFHILVFRDQDLTKDQQAAFSKNFGTLEHHVGRLANGQPFPIVHTVTNLGPDGMPSEKSVSRGNYHWHTDKSYHEVPSLMTMLHAKKVPLNGGDTQFANTQLGYETLSDEMKDRISGLKAEHSWEASRLNVGAEPASEEQKRERPPVTHPVVRTHPDTGQKTIYLGHHVSHLHDIPHDEGAALIKELEEHTTQDRFVYTHRWRAGDYVMWDNRLLLHRALPNYEVGTEQRQLHRTVIIGTKPF
jgi:taurine dioxygenase